MVLRVSNIITSISIAAIVSYIVGGEAEILGWEVSFFTCHQDAHQVVYDFEKGEAICSKCGLVFNEMQLEFSTSPKDFSLKRYQSKVKRCLSLSLKPLRLERTLDALLMKSDASLVVKEKAIEICRDLRKEGVVKGYSSSVVAKGLIYAAHRICRFPTVLSDLEGTSIKDKKEIAHCFNRICRKLELKVPILESTDYMDSLVTKKKISKEIRMQADKILSNAKKRDLLKGANPFGTAATALYIASIASGQKATQKEFAEAAGVSEVTIRTNYKILKNNLQ